MPIVSNLHGVMQIKISKQLLQYFDDNNVKTTRNRGVHRWQPGDIVKAAADARFERYSLFTAGKLILKMGGFSYSFSELSTSFRIGRYCSIAQGVRMMGPQHAMNFVTSSEIVYQRHGAFAGAFNDFGEMNWRFLNNPQPAKLIIGNDVWIGQDVLLKNGISIGDGAVIGAGAVVVKDVLPYEIVGGVPARRIRMRFDEETVRGLSELAWWNYALPQYPQLPWHDPQAFVPAMRELVDAGNAKPFDFDLGSVRTIAANL